MTTDHIGMRKSEKVWEKNCRMLQEKGVLRPSSTGKYIIDGCEIILSRIYIDELKTEVTYLF